MRTFSHPGYKRFLLSVGCLLSIHFTALFFLTLFRLVFFFSANYDFPDQEHVGFMSIWPAFIRGVWFDNVIACYILLIPLVAVSISALFNYYGKILWNVTCIFFSLFYGIVLLVTAANIPYFQYFFKIINSSVFNWFGYMNTTAGMVFGETSYYPPLIGFLLTLVLFIWLMRRLIRHFQRLLNTKNPSVFWLDRRVNSAIRERGLRRSAARNYSAPVVADCSIDPSTFPHAPVSRALRLRSAFR